MVLIYCIWMCDLFIGLAVEREFLFLHFPANLGSEILELNRKLHDLLVGVVFGNDAFLFPPLNNVALALTDNSGIILLEWPQSNLSTPLLEQEVRIEERHLD